ncbi:hypothetical protein G6F68_018655 [Rhizopus microsporus]|nr:hypothetical protein G6F68_018655 [Rhizopus microsporus]
MQRRAPGDHAGTAGTTAHGQPHGGGQPVAVPSPRRRCPVTPRTLWAGATRLGSPPHRCGGLRLPTTAVAHRAPGP